MVSGRIVNNLKLLSEFIRNKVVKNPWRVIKNWVYTFYLLNSFIYLVLFVLFTNNICEFRLLYFYSISNERLTKCGF